MFQKLACMCGMRETRQNAEEDGGGRRWRGKAEGEGGKGELGWKRRRNVPTEARGEKKGRGSERGRE
eukprot:1601009-Pleurochrysis_carterae.AAC.1